MKLTSVLLAVVLAVVGLAACGDLPAPGDEEPSVPAWMAWADAAVLQNPELDGWIDTGYRFPNADPAYGRDNGPTVCVDEAHFNYHTAKGIYWPYAELLRGDGYRVRPFRARFEGHALEECSVLLIANAQAETNTIGFGSPQSNWAYPHASALTKAEIDDLVRWIRGGGALLLIADHTPLPAAVADLALILGVQMFDGYAYNTDPDWTTGDVVFGTVKEDEWWQAIQFLEAKTGVEFVSRFRAVFQNPGALSAHRVIEGRKPGERVEWVVTFQGQAFLASKEWSPILVFGSNAVSLVPLTWNVEGAQGGEGPVLSTAGWLQGATRTLHEGRVAVLGEGGMCTAQFDDLDGELPKPLMPYGMNAPQAPYNAQFCLNVMHWLSGLLDQP